MNRQIFTNREHEIRFFSVLLVALIFAIAVSILAGSNIRREDFSVPTQVTKVFPKVHLEAKGAYVYDARNKTVLYAQNEDESLPLASISKVMTALVAVSSGRPYDTVSVTKEALNVTGDSGLYRDEKWSLKDILDFSLITSSNDGMHAIALAMGALSKVDPTPHEAIQDFVYKMNVKSQELGLTNTHFINETGLDESLVDAGAYSSAKDINTLMEYVLTYYPDLLEVTRETDINIKSLDNHTHVATNTNSIVGTIPGLLASKTGFTDLAGGNLTIVFDPEIGRPIIVTVMGSSSEGRFEDVRTLVDATMQYIGN